jgi:hypothetical protein
MLIFPVGIRMKRGHQVWSYCCECEKLLAHDWIPWISSHVPVSSCVDRAGSGSGSAPRACRSGSESMPGIWRVDKLTFFLQNFNMLLKKFKNLHLLH